MADLTPDIAIPGKAMEAMVQVPQDGDEFTKGYRMACEENARNIRSLIPASGAGPSQSGE